MAYPYPETGLLFTPFSTRRKPAGYDYRSVVTVDSAYIWILLMKHVGPFSSWNLISKIILQYVQLQHGIFMHEIWKTIFNNTTPTTSVLRPVCIRRTPTFDDTLDVG